MPDVGAAAGGFTEALLDAGARRVYVLDAGIDSYAGISPSIRASSTSS